MWGGWGLGRVSRAGALKRAKSSFVPNPESADSIYTNIQACLRPEALRLASFSTPGTHPSCARTSCAVQPPGNKLLDMHERNPNGSNTMIGCSGGERPGAAVATSDGGGSGFLRCAWASCRGCVHLLRKWSARGQSFGFVFVPPGFSEEISSSWKAPAGSPIGRPRRVRAQRGFGGTHVDT